MGLQKNNIRTETKNSIFLFGRFSQTAELKFFSYLNTGTCINFYLGYTIYNEKYSKHQYRNYNVVFNHNSHREFGLIKSLYSIENSIYCVLQFFEKKRNFIDDIPENESIIQTLDLFFLIFNLTNNLILVNVENIIGKCVSSNNGEENFLSILKKIKIFNKVFKSMIIDLVFICSKSIFSQIKMNRKSNKQLGRY